MPQTPVAVNHVKTHLLATLIGLLSVTDILLELFPDDLDQNCALSSVEGTKERLSVVNEQLDKLLVLYVVRGVIMAEACRLRVTLAVILAVEGLEELSLELSDVVLVD